MHTEDTLLAYFDFPHENPRGSSWWNPTPPPLAGATVTTWHGEYIGAITSARIYFGRWQDRRVALRANVGGAIYSGRASWDNGNAVILRKTKRTAL